MQRLDLNIPIVTIVKVIAVLAFAYVLWYLRDLLLIIVASLVIASATEPAIIGLKRYKIPRTLATLMVYSVFFSAFFIVILFLLPPILSETKGLLDSLPGYIDSFSDSSGAGIQETFGNLSMQINTLLKGVSQGNFVGAVTMVFGGLMSFVLIVVFSFYFAISESGIEDFLRTITPEDYEEYILGLWNRSQKKIGLWMQGQLLLAVLIAVLVYLGLMILSVPHALALAVIAGLFELIPVFGPILSALPAIAIAFISGGFSLAVLTVGLYLIIQQFENHLIYPLVVTKVVGVPPVISILALLVGAKLAGILGILLSVPIAAILQEVFNDLGKNKEL